MVKHQSQFYNKYISKDAARVFKKYNILLLITLALWVRVRVENIENMFVVVIKTKTTGAICWC